MNIIPRMPKADFITAMRAKRTTFPEAREKLIARISAMTDAEYDQYHTDREECVRSMTRSK